MECYIKFLFLCFFYPSLCFAYDPIPLDANLNLQGVQGYAEYFEDSKSSFKHPAEFTEGADWQVLTQQKVHVGASTSSYWLRFEVINTSKESRNLYLSHELAFLDFFEIFWFEQNAWQYRRVSGQEPFNQREIKFSRPTIKVSVPPGQTYSLYARFSNNHLEHSSLKLDLWSESVYQDYKDSSIFNNAIFIGIAAAICIIWGIFYLVLRQPRFLAYSVFMGFVCGYYIAYSGFGYQFFYPDYPVIHDRLYLVMLIGASSFSFLFARLHLEPGRKGFKKIDKLLTWLFLVGVLLTVQAIFRFSDPLAVVSAMSYSGLLLVNTIVGFTVWRRFKEDFAFWFMLGWALVGISMFVLMLFYALGVGANIFSNDAAHLLGKAIVLIDGITLSISLARWFQTQQEHKTKAEFAAITDPLTGLFNRRALDHKLSELNEPHVAGRPICLAVLDIDHFKLINDTHGHAVGDLVLKNASRIISQCIRPHDIACRIGGEEFVVIFSDCSTADGIQIAERIRSKFESEPTNTGQELITHTISIGLVTSNSNSTPDYESEFKKADHALYQAKREGRNRVVISASSF
jgi:diguanylate cyclase (GGDEF)-like protein